jgi:hypothetical protein
MLIQDCSSVNEHSVSDPERELLDLFEDSTPKSKAGLKQMVPKKKPKR